MSRDPLTEALRSLPRVRASAGFTQRVLRRLESEPRAESRWLRPALAAAAALTLVAGLWLALGPEESPSPDRRARLEALQAEHARLERELEQIRALAREGPRREIYLGGSDDMDVVLDVGWSAVQDLSRDRGFVPARYEAGAISEERSRRRPR